MKCNRCGTTNPVPYTDRSIELICHECHMSALEASIAAKDECLYESWIPAHAISPGNREK